MQDLSYEQAQTRDVTAQAKQREMDVFNQQQQAKIFQQLAQQHQRGQQMLNTADQQIQRLNETAGALLDGGQPAAAAELLNKASQIEAHRATAKREQDTREQMLFNREQEAAEVADEKWVGIQNQGDLDAAAMSFSDRFPQTKNPFAGQVFSPELIKSHRDTSKAGLAYSRDQRAEKELQERIKNYKRLRDWTDGQRKYFDQSLKVRQAQAKRADKGGIVKGPDPVLQGHAEKMLRERFGDLPKNGIETLGWEIASRAMAITSTNRGVDQAEALHRAMDERQAELKLMNDTYNETHGLWNSVREFFSSKPAAPKEGEVTKGAKPIIGSIWDHHRYIGGDFNKKTSWIPVSPEEESASGEEPEAVDAITGEPVSPEDTE
jgi:hypothetical protein